jgi:hypothetical protein
LDKPETVKGGPYDRSIQVIVTDEFTLNRHTVEAFLAEDGTVEGFNVGINSGEVTGQTVMHCHVHLLPRRRGDVNQLLEWPQTKRPGHIGPGLQACTSTSVIIGFDRSLQSGSQPARYQGRAVRGRTSPRNGGPPLYVSARFEAQPEDRSGTSLFLTTAAERNASARTLLTAELVIEREGLADSSSEVGA